MSIQNLIVLGGHGVVVEPTRPCESDSWVGIYNYPEEARLLTEHCQAAVTLASDKPDAALVLSGGVTRAEAPGLSESQSYFTLAQAADWWGHPKVESRTLIEEHARDSLGNMLLSLALFKHKFGFYPQSITAVGFDFKKERFRRHAQALGWQRFRYVSINNPPKRSGVLAQALAGEEAKRRALEADPLLRAKRWRMQRLQRNPLHQPRPRFDDDPELDSFLEFVLNDGPRRRPPWCC